MNIWIYITTPTNGRLGPAAGLVIFLSLLAIVGGVWLAILPGLITPWLSTFVLLTLPLPVVYLIVYLLRFYPRFRDVCRIADTHKSYDPAS